MLLLLGPGHKYCACQSLHPVDGTRCVWLEAPLPSPQGGCQTWRTSTFSMFRRSLRKHPLLRHQRRHRRREPARPRPSLSKCFAACTSQGASSRPTSGASCARMVCVLGTCVRQIFLWRHSRQSEPWRSSQRQRFPSLAPPIPHLECAAAPAVGRVTRRDRPRLQSSSSRRKPTGARSSPATFSTACLRGPATSTLRSCHRTPPRQSAAHSCLTVRPAAGARESRPACDGSSGRRRRRGAGKCLLSGPA